MFRFPRIDRVIVVAAASMLLVAAVSQGAPVRKVRVSRSPMTSARQLVAQAEPAPPAPMRALEKEGRPSARRMPESPIEGKYAFVGGTEVKVVRMRGDVYLLVSPDGWEGVGILEGSTYRGVLRYRGSRDLPDGTMGYQTIDWTDPNNPSARTEYTGVQRDPLVQKWHRMGEPHPPERPIVVAPPEPGQRPAFGEYVYVEVLPEAVTKATPVYPDDAMKSGVEGTVMVQALVLEDGTVGDYRIVKSIPPLDQAAIDCVRQWHFKPALNKGNPVAVWVAVPVQFKLH
jgi:TonB family protein